MIWKIICQLVPSAALSEKQKIESMDKESKVMIDEYLATMSNVTKS